MMISFKFNRLKLLILTSLSVLSSTALASTALTVNVVNNSPAVANLDYTSFTTITPALSNNTLPYLSTTTFSVNGSGTQQLYIEQYGATAFLSDPQPKCYYTFTLSGSTWSYSADSGTTAAYCTMKQDSTTKVFTLNIAWPAPAAVDYTAVMANANTIVDGFLTKQSDNAHYMVANQAPLSSTQMTSFTNAAATSGWTLQFAYDSIRLPLWTGAYYAQSTDKASLTSSANYLTGLTDYIDSHTCTNASGQTSVNTQGFWAATTSVANAGDPVEVQACGTTPALEGPLAMAALAVNNTSLTNALVTTLNSYSIADNTFAAFATANGSTLTESTYTSSSSPYFNGTLDLISEALLIGKGSFDISAANNGDTSSTDYLNYQKFQANYQAWLNDGFVVAFQAPTPGNGTVSAASKRVLYSTYNGIDYKNNDPANTTGNSPTVSEGMGYGLLIAYAAGDQATFDQFLTFILSEAYYQGCASMNQGQTACSVKSQYLMPWMIDETGKPFNYQVGGGYMTSGSATDADIQIIMALDLAQKRVDAGTWTSSLFSGLNYGQVATAMSNEVNRYEINYGVLYYGNTLSGNGVMFSPGSQWGMPSDSSNTNLIYPGYITPQAFQVLQNRQTQ